MKDKKIYGDLLDSLAKDAVTLEVDGLTVEVRNCADRKPGHLDPRVAVAAGITREELTNNRQTYDPELWPNGDHLYGTEDQENYDELAMQRFLGGWTSSDMSSGVTSENLRISTPAGPIEVWKYEVPSPRKNRPCMVFFHGGGFFSGIIPTVENQCKLLAQLADAVVLAPDYPLAPEHPYPAGFDACYATVECVFANAEKLGIDRGKMAVSGDSAGGNLALICALRDRAEGKGMIAYQALIYPTLSRLGKKDPYYFWREEDYENPANDAYIAKQIRLIGESNEMLNHWYVPAGADLHSPYLSPIASPVEGLPPTLMIVAEYDYLRSECEAYSRMLQKGGVRQRLIRYGGLTHGTFDRLGYSPQVEDMVREISKDLQAL